MDYDVKSAEKGVDAKNAGYWPTAGLMGKYGFSDDQFSVEGDKGYYMVALGINYTLFDGGLRSSQSEQAKLDYRKAALYREYMESGIALEVERSYRTLNAKNAIIEQKQKAKELAVSVLDKAKVMYKNGLINMTELLVKEADALQARAELIKAKYDKALAAANLLVSAGIQLNQGE